MSSLRRSSVAIEVVLQRNYGLYTAGSTLSLFGLWAHRLAVAWLAWQLTESSFWVGFVAFADLIPTVVLTPFAGVIADRYDRRLITLISQFLGMGQAFALSWLVLSGRMTEHADIWWLFGWTLFLGAVWAFNTAARLAMVPTLVEHRHIPQAIAINSVIFNLARIVGPAIAGVIIAQWGIGEAFLFNAVTFVTFIVSLFVIRPIRDEEPRRSRGGFLADAWSGIAYARHHPGIGPMLILLIALAIGAKSTLELLPEFADHVFARGEAGLAEMITVAGVGALFSALYLAQRRSVEGLTRLCIGVLAIGALAIFAFAATDFYPLALAGILILGGATIFGGAATQTLMQHAVDGSMRGRAMSLYGMVSRGCPAIGAVAMGALAELITIRAAVALGGVLCLLAWLWLLRRRDAIAAAIEAPHPG